MMTRPILLLALLACGCSSAQSGTDQVTISSDPPGASCAVERGGATLGVVDPTPGALTVSQSDKALSVTCRKDGWRPGTGEIAALYKGIGVGRLLTGGFAAVVEDTAKSTDFTYDSRGFVVTLTR